MAFGVASSGEALHTGCSRNINKVQHLHARKRLVPVSYPIHKQLSLRISRPLSNTRLASSQDSDLTFPPGGEGTPRPGDSAATTNGEQASQTESLGAKQNVQDPLGAASIEVGEAGQKQKFTTIGDVVENGPLAGSLSREEAAFTAALQEDNAQRAARGSQESSPRPQLSAFPPRPVPGGPPRATLERLAKARQYREAAEQRFARSSNSGETVSPGSGASTTGPSQLGGSSEMPAMSAASQAGVPSAPLPPPPGLTVSSLGGAGALNDPVAARDGTSGSASEAPQLGPQSSSRLMGGTEKEAAQFLSKVVGESSGVKMEEGMSMEQFTLKKEAEMKARGAEIITIGGATATGDEKAGGYRPKVSTWGVFPRPQNISQAFGGGRNIKPGQELESEKDRLAREERVRTAMLQYRKNMGLDIDPEVQKACQVAYDAGMELLNDGRLSDAVVRFDAVIEGMSLATQLGGEARLQKAICLDSLGRSEEAYTLYRQIQRHPCGTVAKRAKRMLFGFEAAENLKAHTISYAPSKGEYDKYFRKMTSDWNSAYVPSEKDSQTDLTTVMFATAVMLSPIILMGAKVGAKLLKAP